MIVSTKGRYALRVIIDLAINGNDEYISLKDISERSLISMKYLESIVSNLNKHGLLDSLRGKKGGYKLNRPTGEYTVGMILKASEGSLAPVACVNCGDVQCNEAHDCITLSMWKKLDSVIDSYLESVTIEDLINGKVE